jgi:hypothetical protein
MEDYRTDSELSLSCESSSFEEGEDDVDYEDNRTTDVIPAFGIKPYQYEPYFSNSDVSDSESNVSEIDGDVNQANRLLDNSW